MISRIRAYLTEIPLREPFRIALGTSTVSRNVVIEVETRDGITGMGEASPSKRVLGEDIESVVSTLNMIYHKISGWESLSLEKAYSLLHGTSGSPSAKAALDMALLDIVGKDLGVPVFRLLGGFRDSIETDITIGIMDPEEQARRAVMHVESGFRILKVKLGEDPETDIRRVRAVRDAVGEGIKIRVDANQGWSVEEAIRVIDRISGYDVELVEQPVRWDDLSGLAEVRKNSPVPVAADESVKTPEDAIRAIEMDAVDIINIKLMKSEGICGAVRIAHISEAAGVKNMVGCMGESGVGITAAVHVAQALRNIEYCDLDSDLLHAEDIVEEGRASISNGTRRVSEKPGLGLKELRRGMLKPIMSLPRQ